MGWDASLAPDPMDRATFESARLDWSEAADARHARLLAWYRRLIELRREAPATARATEVGFAAGVFAAGVFAFTRAALRVEVALSGHGLPGLPAAGAPAVAAAFDDAVRVTRIVTQG
jgi:maltooligosyltrehalose trehalohydrolase